MTASKDRDQYLGKERTLLLKLLKMGGLLLVAFLDLAEFFGNRGHLVTAALERVSLKTLSDGIGC